MDAANIEDWTDIRQLILMCVGTDKGRWWANSDFGSELWLLRQTGKVDGTTAGKVRAMVLECTAWLQADGLVREIECRAERTGKNEIRYELTAHKADGSAVFVKDVWYGIN